MFVNTMPRYEILSEDAMAILDRGWRRIVTEIGIEFLLDEAVEPFRAAGQQVEGQNGDPRPRVRARAGGQGAARVRRAGAQPGAARSTSAASTWPSPRSTAARSCARATSRRDATMDDFENLVRLSQAFPELDSPGGVICEPNDTPAGLAPPRHGLRAADADRQALHGHRDLGPERRGHDRDGGDPLRRPRGDRGDAGVDLADQLQLAAALGRPDAQRAVRVRARQPGR